MKPVRGIGCRLRQLDAKRVAGVNWKTRHRNGLANRDVSSDTYNVRIEKEFMDTILKHLSQVRQGLDLLNLNEISMAVSALRLVKEQGGTVYLFGNGGSAALASHFTNDLIKMGRVKAVCLCDAFPVTSAYGNDEGWESMYLNQLKVVFDYKKDMVIGISCSGNSENVVRALEWACKEGALAIGMTGNTGNSKIHGIGVFPLIHAPVPDIRVQEDLHAVCCHAIARELAEEE